MSVVAASRPTTSPCAKHRQLFLACAWESPPPATLEDLATHGQDRPAWAAAASLACRVGQEPLFLRHLQRHGLTPVLDDKTLQDLVAQARYHCFRWAGMHQAVLPLLDALRCRGVRPILLKGISVVGKLYDPPCLRPMRDVDLLVRPEELDAARRAAIDAGFGDAPSAEAHEAHAGHHHLPPLFHEETGACLELHHAILHPRHAEAGFPAGDALWQGTRPSGLYPAADQLEPATGLVVLCAHVTHGDTIGRRAHNLLDVARYVEMHGPELDWDRVVAFARAPAVARALAVPLSYLAREGLATAPAESLRALLRLAKLRDWELRLLWALTDRYRLGMPAAWPLVSGRIANILWRQTLRCGGTLGRGAAALLATVGVRPRR